ncbi:AAA family ATPase [bacterium]|nr:AAA family ATPase [bacterium]
MVVTRSQKHKLEELDDYEFFSLFPITQQMRLKKKRHLETESQVTDTERTDIEDTDVTEETNTDVTTSNTYDQFFDLVESIYDGQFFERVPIEDRKREFQQMYTEVEVQRMNTRLLEIQKHYRDSAPSIIDILKLTNNDTIRKKLEKVYHLANCETLSSEYTQNMKALEFIKPPSELESKILEATKSLQYNDNYKEKILSSEMSFNNKVIAYKRLELMQSYKDSDSSEYAKHKAWMDTLLSIPFNNQLHSEQLHPDLTEFIKGVRNTLDKHLSFLEKPKDQIINIVAQQLRNPNTTINAIGLYGVKGIGKTKITQSIAEALGRPYRAISLGGESDSSILAGHHFTYIGSTPGRIIEILKETQCTNPIVLFDELDKVSNTHHGKEIIGSLIHLTDTSTNNKYKGDRYFSGIEFDLSKVLFIFTYNDPSKVDKILADRLFKIKINNYSYLEKLEITKKHLINNVLLEFNFCPNDIQFTEDTISYIVKSSQDDEGMRDIKRKFEVIVSRINTLLYTQNAQDIVRLKYKELKSFYTTLPVTVQQTHIDTFLCDMEISEDKIVPFGMYV